VNRRDQMTLAEQITRRLILAGIKPDDPGLVAIREWNAAVYRRAGTDSSDISDRDGTHGPLPALEETAPARLASR
jgi:hypothetical protein